MGLLLGLLEELLEGLLVGLLEGLLLECLCNSSILVGLLDSRTVYATDPII